MTEPKPMTAEDVAAFQAQVQLHWQAEVRDRAEDAVFRADVPIQPYYVADKLDTEFPDPVDHARALRRGARAEIRKYPAAAYRETFAVKSELVHQHGNWLLVTSAEFGAAPL